MISTERDAPSSIRARHAAARVAPARGPGRLEYIRAAGERPPRARPQRRGSPGPIPNPAVKPAFAESTAARGCGRAGRRARGGRFSMRVRAPGAARAACAERGPQGDVAPCGLFRVLGRRPPHPTSSEIAPFRLAVIAATMRRARRRAAEGPPQRLFFASRVAIDLTVPAALRRHRACRGTLLQAFFACGCRKLL